MSPSSPEDLLSGFPGFVNLPFVDLSDPLDLSIFSDNLDFLDFQSESHPRKYLCATDMKRELSLDDEMYNRVMVVSYFLLLFLILYFDEN